MKQYIKETLKLAKKAASHGDVPVGAVIVRGGKIISRGENQVQLKRDVTAHAEIVAIRRAAKKLGAKFLDDAEIYISLEPCAMCATAISFARIKKIIFAARDEKGGGILHNARVYETQKNLWKPEVAEVPEFAAESAELLREFFRKRRIN
ncbi:MAG: nucleoside deaminase [Alphaproteobacteria bacterium]|nr:nucleoside deaminase [Alphaproteobacteria bacterium]